MIFLAFTACKSSSKTHKNPAIHKNNPDFYENYSKKLGYELEGSEDRKFLENVVAWIGVPYKYGGCTKEGTDCSCFVSSIYKDVFGITLPRKSEDIQQLTVSIDKEILKQGDLIFFKITGEKVSHVGIYISKKYFIHATTSKGVIINSLDERYYQKYFHKAGRVKG
jgi:cell wall-associated NlpC family hydrolase